MKLPPCPCGFAYGPVVTLGGQAYAWCRGCGRQGFWLVSECTACYGRGERTTLGMRGKHNCPRCAGTGLALQLREGTEIT